MATTTWPATTRCAPPTADVPAAASGAPAPLPDRTDLDRHLMEACRFPASLRAAAPPMTEMAGRMSKERTMWRRLGAVGAIAVIVGCAGKW